MRINTLFRLVGALSVATSTSAVASNCGRGPCSASVAVKGTSILPPPDEFSLRGDLFSSVFTDVALQTNGSREIALGFNVNFGFGVVNSLFINENGIVSFLRPIGAFSTAPAARSSFASVIVGAPFIPVSSLADFGVPVIAPFYADLEKGAGSGDTRLNLGDIVVQYGQADPYANNGAYDRADARPAVRITWYGLNLDANQLARSAPVYAQLLLSSDLDGLSNFEFRYGPLDNPGQAGRGSIAGFSLGDTLLQFGGPYVDGIPNFFEFQDGSYIGQGVTAAVPEPDVWLEMVIGFGILGAALRSTKRSSRHAGGRSVRRKEAAVGAGPQPLLAS